MNCQSIAGLLLFAASSAYAQLDPIPQTRLDPKLRCQLGVYALPDGKSVTITGVGGQPRGLQYTLSNGHFGNLQEDPSSTFKAGTLELRFESCDALRFTHQGKTLRGSRVRLAEQETTFVSDGIQLRGKLVLPPNGRADTAAVWIEGSNNDPSTDDTVWQYELARRGVTMFVYDKRGTGASAGAPTSDFEARARDTAAAVKELRRLAPNVRRVGVIGGSQGGWVAPLTATLVPLDFVIPAFAMAEGPTAQDREIVLQQLRQAGFTSVDLAHAKELTAITERIVRSNMRDGLADLDAFKSRHGAAPWLNAIQPRSYTGVFLKFSSQDIQSKGPAMAQGLSFGFDPKPLIESIKARQLWLLGGSDQQAPNAGTQAFLKDLQSRRSNIAVVVFPKADHGLIEKTGSGVAYSARLFDIAAEWIRTRKLPATARFVVMPAAN